MKSNRFLAWLARVAQAIDRRLGDPVVKRPAFLGFPPGSHEPLEPVKRFTCRGCQRRFDGPGYVVPTLAGELHFCSEACAPPFLREGREIPDLAGEPGR